MYQNQDITSWLKHITSYQHKHKEAVQAKIKTIYNDSKQDYGAPKITNQLRRDGDAISERTVGNYMRKMGIRAQWVKLYTVTTKDSDFSNELENILNEHQFVLRY